MAQSAKAQRYLKFLQKEGLNAHIDSDGDVIFKVGPLTYYIDVDESDEAYFRIVFPNFKEIKDKKEYLKALEAAHYATRVTKVAKVWITPDGKRVSASIEIFIADPDGFQPIFKRSLSALMTAVTHFASKM